MKYKARGVTTIPLAGSDFSVCDITEIDEEKGEEENIFCTIISIQKYSSTPGTELHKAAEKIALALNRNNQ